MCHDTFVINKRFWPTLIKHYYCSLPAFYRTTVLKKKTTNKKLVRKHNFIKLENKRDFVLFYENRNVSFV